MTDDEQRRWEESRVPLGVPFVLCEINIKFIRVGVLSAGVPVYNCIQIEVLQIHINRKPLFLHIIENLLISISHVFFILRLNIYLMKTIAKALDS